MIQIKPFYQISRRTQRLLINWVIAITLVTVMFVTIHFLGYTEILGDNRYFGPDSDMPQQPIVFDSSVQKLIDAGQI